MLRHLVQPGTNPGAGFLVGLHQDLALAVHRRKDVAAGIGDEQLHHLGEAAQPVTENCQQVVDALTGVSGYLQRTLVAAKEVLDAFLTDLVGLVEHDELGDVARADLAEHRPHRIDVELGVGTRSVHKVQQQVGFGDFLEGRLERLDEAGGQLLDEAHRVGDQHRLTTRQLQAPGGGVEGGEQAILDENTGTGEMVQQGGLAGVGVPDDGDGVEPGPTPRLALVLAGAPQPAEILLQLGEPPLDAPPVDLELGLTRAPGADATALLAELIAPSPQTGQPIAELGQLDLGLALEGGGVLGEDVEDHRGAVEGGALQDLLEVVLLCRAELVVEHHGVGVVVDGRIEDLAGLALADEGGGVGCVALLHDPVDGVGTSGVDEPGEFVEVGVDLVGGLPGELHTHQHDLLTEGTVDEAAGLATELAERAAVSLDVASIDEVVGVHVIAHSATSPVGQSTVAM